MMQIRLAMGAVMLAMLIGCAPAQVPTPAAPTVTAEPQRLTFDDAITLRNAHLHIAVAPSVGRIVAFGPADSRNLIWINTIEGNQPFIGRGPPYYVYGGDKVWTLVQSVWKLAFGGGSWPPDGVIDGQPWDVVESGDHHIILQSRVSPALGHRVRREIRIDPDQPRVVIRNHIIQEQASHFSPMIWCVTQVHPPQFTLMELSPQRPTSSRPWTDLSNKPVDTSRIHISDDNRWLRYDYIPDRSQKIGAFGRWVAGVWEDYIFVQTTDYDPTGAYPDASSLQVYYDANFLELETLSPQVHLRPGQTLTNTVTWWLLPRAAMTDVQIAAQAEALVRTSADDR